MPWCQPQDLDKGESCKHPLRIQEAASSHKGDEHNAHDQWARDHNGHYVVSLDQTGM